MVVGWLHAWGKVSKDATQHSNGSEGYIVELTSSPLTLTLTMQVKILPNFRPSAVIHRLHEVL